MLLSFSVISQHLRKRVFQSASWTLGLFPSGWLCLPVCIWFTSTNTSEQKTTVLAGFCLRCAFLVPPSGQLEKAMATYSSSLAWKIPWTEEPGRLQSMGWVAKSRAGLSNFTFTHWRRKWQPTPVFLPGEFQGWRSLVGCCLWGHIESDTTETT